MDFRKASPVAGGWSDRRIQVADRNFDVVAPTLPDEMLNHFQLPSDSLLETQIPHWGRMWPAATIMAESIVRHAWVPGLRMLELGSGVGLIGLAALSCGLDVTMSDYVPLSVQTCLENARRNGFPDAHGLVLDWRAPTTTQFPLIMACEVLYEREHHAPLLNVMEHMLSAGGEFWIGDSGRVLARDFLHTATDRGMTTRIFDRAGRECLMPSKGEYQMFVVKRGTNT